MDFQETLKSKRLWYLWPLKPNISLGICFPNYVGYLIILSHPSPAAEKNFPLLRRLIFAAKKCFLFKDFGVPLCEFCDDELLTVKHIMIHCTHYSAVRRRYFNVHDMRELFNVVSLRKIISYLKEAQLFKLL